MPQLIERYSQVMTLEPGDLIATGTPDGVGPLAPGDEIELAISRVGRLQMQVAPRPDLILRTRCRLGTVSLWLSPSDVTASSPAST